VMDQGRIAQVGTPEEVYHAPTSPFVATFMGADNTIALKIGQGPAGPEVEAGAHHAATPIHGPVPAGPVTAYFRDDAARIERPDHQTNDEIMLKGMIAVRSYPGGHYRYAVAVGEREFTVRDTRLLDVGTPVGLCLPTRALHLFPDDGASTRSN
jgi:ABC-type Fe3+/spermidine/putrescine transport system ATPase subunit